MEALRFAGYAGALDTTAPGRDDLAARAAAPRALAPAMLAGTREGLQSLPALLGAAVDAAAKARRPAGPLPAGRPAQILAQAAAALGPSELPVDGIGGDAALRRIARLLVELGIDLSHPRAAAHLQPPPLAVAVAADALASAGNASLDTFDSGGSALAIERWLIGVLTRMAGLGPRADGVLTPGGSMSNLLGILLARDAAAWRCGVDARRQGVAMLRGPLVMCSELAHFSVHRACAALGLGEAAVRVLPTDERRRIIPAALADLLAKLGPDETPIAIVATAGTTDFGSVDPLDEIADLVAPREIWLHVDAAYGFGALFSDRLAHRVAGIARANSITLDLHKVGWQPAATSALLVADASAFTALEREVAYLNPSDDADAGLDGLLGRSLQTTRRPDAVKVAATMLAYGRRGLGEMVDQCHDLAAHAARRIAGEPELQLVSPADLTTVTFRYRGTPIAGHPPISDEALDELNGRMRRVLIERGTALIGRTSARTAGPGSPMRVCLKFTLLNPTCTTRDIDELIQTVLETGRACDARRA